MKAPVGAGLSTTALLSSALLGAASLSPQRDYSFSFWQEIPEVKSRGLLEGLPSQQRHLQEVPEKGVSRGKKRAQAAAEASGRVGGKIWTIGTRDRVQALTERKKQRWEILH